MWSFGILLWELMSDGKKPYYQIIENKEVVQEVLQGTIMSKPTSCPDEIYSILKRIP